MSIHKLTAGSGYDYLTRQVATLHVLPHLPREPISLIRRGSPTICTTRLRGLSEA